MKKIIVSTSINPPTEAIQAFDAMKDWTLIVVGDLKTPKDYKLERGHYLTPNDQALMDVPLSDCIGWNCIQRRNFGFIMAHRMGADIVATVDDDNVPLPGWGEDLLIGKDWVIPTYATTQPVFDPISVTNHRELWHRGFPLQLVGTRRNDPLIHDRYMRPDIQADFWNGEPDIDAVCRMIHAPQDCNFTKPGFAYASTQFGPFNSQNTFLSARVLKHYFMFPFVGRMDDIWPSYYVQALGYKVVWNKPSVFQKRLPITEGSNPNAGGGGVIANMRGEYLGYENNLEIVKRLHLDSESIWEYCPGRTRRAYELYRKHFND